MAYNIGVANFVRTWFSTWQWSDLPMISYQSWQSNYLRSCLPSMQPGWWIVRKILITTNPVRLSKDTILEDIVQKYLGYLSMFKIGGKFCSPSFERVTERLQTSSSAMTILHMGSWSMIWHPLSSMRQWPGKVHLALNNLVQEWSQNQVTIGSYKS